MKTETHLCTTPGEILETLRRIQSGDGFCHGEPPTPRWIFRGHASREWHLHASLHRALLDPEQSPLHDASILHDLHQLTQLDKQPDTAPQTLREMWLNGVSDQFSKWIVSFALGASKAGLLTGAAAATATETINNFELVGEAHAWPTMDKIISLVGLAQHHGIPTPLLDWTWNPLVATWFAIESTVKSSRWMDQSFPITENTSCAEVWCIPVILLRRTERLGLRILLDQSFAKAQDGVFTIDRSAEHEYARAGKIKTLDAIIEGADHDDPYEPTWYPEGLPMPHRVQFPRFIAGDLIYLLRDAGISSMTLRPTLSNVAAQTLDKFAP